MAFATALFGQPVKLVTRPESGTIDYNPIAKLNKAYRKGRSNQQEQTANRVGVLHETGTGQQLRFSSLSRNKENSCFSQNRLVHDQSGFMKKTNLLKNNNLLEFSNIRKRLDLDRTPSRTSSSKSKGPTFTDIIRKSRQKAFREESRSKKGQVVSDCKARSKEVASFNKLKGKVIGQRRLQDTKNTGWIQIVRVSCQFGQNELNQSLNMQPTL